MTSVARSGPSAVHRVDVRRPLRRLHLGDSDTNNLQDIPYPYPVQIRDIKGFFKCYRMKVFHIINIIQNRLYFTNEGNSYYYLRTYE